MRQQPNESRELVPVARWDEEAIGLVPLSFVSFVSFCKIRKEIEQKATKETK
jgi:hypothetical protein